MPSPMIKATVAAAALSSASNILAQFLQAYREGEPFVFDFASFLRFVTVTFLTAPPNYMWQGLLERAFPAYGRTANPLAVVTGSHGPSGGRDLEKQLADVGGGGEGVLLAGGGGGGGGDANSSSGGGEDGDPRRGRRRLNVRNTLSKWFIDCITLGAVMNTVAFFILMGFLKRQPLAQIGHNIRTQTVPVIVAGYKIWPFASIVSFSCVPVERRIVFLNFVGLLWGIYMSLVASRV
ncbi:hypothetical protein F4809DRAFT_665019 [Biscogniauxia mediterranea]|nr:hypothetical protein F4809DRAFT_665019 [Biscogniauxia mediterranea]